MVDETFDERHLATARADESIAERRRERWLLAQADEETTIAGVVASLAGAGRPCRFELVNGSDTTGVPEGVGPDWVRIRDRGTTTFVRTDGIDAVRAPGATERMATPDPDGLGAAPPMAEVLAELAIDRPRVRLATRSGAVVVGELERVGTNVLTVDGDGTERGLVYIRLGSVLAVSLMTSG